MKTRRRPRQADIARLAGVSQTTVSLVINGRDATAARISSATRDKILEVAQSLGYVVNTAARGLAGGRSGIIGLYTFESMFPMEQHDFYHPFLVGIEAAVEARGYDLLMFTSATGAQGVKSIYHEGVNRLQLADGCVLLGKEMDKGVIARLRDDGARFVLIGRRDIPDDGVSYVTADYAEATRRVVAHLVELGHRRIAYLPSPGSAEPTVDRHRGFRAAVKEFGLDVGDLEMAVDITGPGSEDMARLVDRSCTAIIAHESVVALTVIERLQAAGLRVPEDVSVAALTDPPEGLEAPELTCFRIPRHEMGMAAVQLLVTQLDGNPDEPSAVILPCTVAAGETSGPCPRREGK